ncbi:MAG: putative endonuclease [Myxococcota bacterium]|jgi:putative endonuclease
MADPRHRLGRRGEARARRYLRRRGLRIIAKNWRDATGELDIIARDGSQVVFVEVRTSRAGYAGSPLATVGPQKQAKLLRLGERWLAASRWQPDSVRFDVVGLTPIGRWRWTITWVKNAFELS